MVVHASAGSCTADGRAEVRASALFAMFPGCQERRLDFLLGGAAKGPGGWGLGGTLLLCNRPPFVSARSLDALGVSTGRGEPMPLRDTPLLRREEQLHDCHLTWLGALSAFVSGRRFAFDLSAILSRTTLQTIPAFCACVYRAHMTSPLLDLIVQGVGWRV